MNRLIARRRSSGTARLCGGALVAGGTAPSSPVAATPGRAARRTRGANVHGRLDHLRQRLDGLRHHYGAAPASDPVHGHEPWRHHDPLGRDRPGQNESANATVTLSWVAGQLVYVSNGDTSAVCVPTADSVACAYTDFAHQYKYDSFTFTVGPTRPGPR